MSTKAYYTDPATIVADGMLTAEGRAMIRAYDAAFGSVWRWATAELSRTDKSEFARGQSSGAWITCVCLLEQHPSYVLVCAPTMPLMEECPRCYGNGSGYPYGTDRHKTCSTCDGTGKRSVICEACGDRDATVRGVDGDTDPLCWPCAKFRQTHPGEIGIFDGDTVTT